MTESTLKFLLVLRISLASFWIFESCTAFLGDGILSTRLEDSFSLVAFASLVVQLRSQLDAAGVAQRQIFLFCGVTTLVMAIANTVVVQLRLGRIKK